MYNLYKEVSPVDGDLSYDFLSRTLGRGGLFLCPKTKCNDRYDQHSHTKYGTINDPLGLLDGGIM